MGNGEEYMGSGGGIWVVVEVWVVVERIYG